jgi:hypothetical protein
VAAVVGAGAVVEGRRRVDVGELGVEGAPGEGGRRGHRDQHRRRGGGALAVAGGGDPGAQARVSHPDQLVGLQVAARRGELGLGQDGADVVGGDRGRREVADGAAGLVDAAEGEPVVAGGGGRDGGGDGSGGGHAVMM